MLDLTVLGRRSAPKTKVVRAEEIERFARAVGCKNPFSVDETSARRAGYRGLVAPPTFPLAFRCQPIEGVELPSQGLIHGEHVLRWEAAICAGDRITAVTRLADMYVKEGQSGLMGFIVREVRGWTDEEPLVYVSRWTSVIRESLLREMKVDSSTLKANAHRQRGPGPPERSECQTGAEAVALPKLRKAAITRRQLVEYAAASGDFNPIHYDDDAARAVGMPGVVAQGALSMAFAAEQIVNWVGTGNRLRSLSVRFCRPVFPGDVLICRAEATGPGGIRIEVAKSGSDPGEVVLSGGAALENTDLIGTGSLDSTGVTG